MKRAVGEMRKVTVGIVRHTIERHMVKIAFLEEITRKTCFRCSVIDLLVNDLHGPVHLQFYGLVLELLMAGPGIGDGQQGLLHLKVPDRLAEHRHFPGIGPSIRFCRPIQQGLQRHIVPALDIVVYIPYTAGPVAAVVLDGVNVLQQVSDLLADLMAA